MQVLRGIRVLEFAGLAPGPYCGLLLSDFGADVIRVNRTGTEEQFHESFLARGKRSIQLDLKSPNSIEILKKHMIPQMDIVIDPYRPGVLEKLGLGPIDVLSWNNRLIYARLTGYGQNGPFAHQAGHDINYLAISGALSSIQRRNDKPLAPVNYLADFAGGGLFCAYGILLALYERTQSGKGQVIDAAMMDGVCHLSTFIHKFHESGYWDANNPGYNLIDSGAPFYDTYETKDGKYMAVGAIERQFYDALIQVLDLKHVLLEKQDDYMDPSTWPILRKEFTNKFLTKTQDEWIKAFENVDACVTPVLSLPKMMKHPHNMARQVIHNTSDPVPTPRLSRTPGKVSKHVSRNGQDTIEVLKEFHVPEHLMSHAMSKL